MSGATMRQVTVRRGGRTILEQVDADFEAGTLTAVIGPNGAGKSTLLSVLAGLTRIDAGTVAIDDRGLDGFRPRELARWRAYLPQNPRIESPIAVERVVALGLTPQLPVFGALLPGGGEALERALEACDLLSLRSRPATTLSGGELARTMLARALVGDPQLLIVDEPTAGLDPRHAIDACKRLRSRADDGRTVVVALHDLNLAARFADRVLALRSGTVAFAGAAGKVLENEALSRLFEARAHVRRDDGGAVAINFD